MLLRGLFPEAGIAYRHLSTLGSLRHRTKATEPSTNMLWRVAAFRNYADYAGTDAFRAGLDELRRSPKTTAARSCALKPCSGVVIVESSPTIFWPETFQSCISWGAVTSIPRSLRPARMCWPTGRSYIRPRKARSKLENEDAWLRRSQLASEVLGCLLGDQCRGRHHLSYKSDGHPRGARPGCPGRAK